jgi:hypothetical protein
VLAASRGGNSSTRTGAQILQFTGASGNGIGTAHVPGALILKQKIIKADAADYAKTDGGDTEDSAAALANRIDLTADLWLG